MDRVDQVILNQLKELQCIHNNVKRLVDLKYDDIINCTLQCLKKIGCKRYNELVKLQAGAEANMAARYRVANELAIACNSLGYKGKLEYQVFLYAPLNDLRNLLLFLTERISREDAVGVLIENKNLSKNHERFRMNGRYNIGPIQRQQVRKFGNSAIDDDLLKDLWSTREVKFKPLVAPRRTTASPSIPQVTPRRQTIKIDSRNTFFAHIVSLCEWSQLNLIGGPKFIPSGSYEGSRIVTIDRKKSDHSCELAGIDQNFGQIIDSNVTGNVSTEAASQANNDLHIDREDKISPEIVKQKEVSIKSLEEQFVDLRDKFDEMSNKKMLLSHMEQKIETFRKEYNVLRSQLKPMEKLQSELKNVLQELQDYHNQWIHAENILSGEIALLKLDIQSQSSVGSTRYQNELAEIHSSMKERKDIIALGNLKILRLNQKLMSEKFKSREATNSRSFYVEQIMDILGQVKKQKMEIDKVINETRKFQKEVNNLSGRLQRSFLLAEESIFRGAQTDDWSRRCYKLLACMYEACDEIMQATRYVGETLRENIQVEESIEIERSKGSMSNFEMLLRDLRAIKLENEALSTSLLFQEANV